MNIYNNQLFWCENKGFYGTHPHMGMNHEIPPKYATTEKNMCIKLIVHIHVYTYMVFMYMQMYYVVSVIYYVSCMVYM